MKQIKLGVERSMEVVRSQSLDYVPVLTGRLKLSIQGGIDGINEIKNEGRDIVGYVGTNVPYASYQEFGTSKMKGKYYLTKGFQQSEMIIRGIFSKIKL
jgi:HK97 gp10 family phage protein